MTDSIFPARAPSNEAPFSVVYVLTNPAMPGLVKIGKTSQHDANLRIGQLYSTGVPFPFELAFACRVRNPDEVEQALHLAFAPNRVNPKREFFSIDPAQAIAILKLLHTQDATAEVASQPDNIEEQEVAAAREFRARRPNLNFDEMGIPLGATLESRAGGAVISIAGPRKVLFEGEEMSLTAATRRVLGLDYSVAPGPYWTYQGRLLREIYEQTYERED